MKKKKDMKKPLLAAVLACSMVQIPAIPVAAAAPENLALNQTAGEQLRIWLRMNGSM